VIRTFIGPAGSDAGKNPPFGTAKPLVIVGLDTDGLASATTIGMEAKDWPTLQVTPLEHIGTDLAGVKLTGHGLRQVIEYMGRGLAARLWWVYGLSPDTGAALVFCSGETGKVASVMASADTALAAPAAGGAVSTQAAGWRIVLRGNFPEVYDASDPSRNRAPQPAHEVVLSSSTGGVVSVR